MAVEDNRTQALGEPMTPWQAKRASKLVAEPMPEQVAEAGTETVTKKRKKKKLRKS